MKVKTAARMPRYWAQPYSSGMLAPHADTHLDGNECPFCRIVRGRDPSVEIVGEATDWVAFFPNAPATPGHTLVVPREHVANYWLLPEDLASDLSIGALRVGNAVQEALGPEGMNLITSSGEAAEQTILHLHLHVLPRWANDNMGPIWPPKHEIDSGTERRLADRVRLALRR